jgi:hypothetical protein
MVKDGEGWYGDGMGTRWGRLVMENGEKRCQHCIFKDVLIKSHLVLIWIYFKYSLFLVNQIK